MGLPKVRSSSIAHNGSQMEESAKETVIIVHGTWAEPQPGVIRWYQPGDGTTAAGGFVSKLDAALQKRGSPARCWAHCAHADQFFNWPGENSWIARTQAASGLAAYVTKLRNDGWCCHIVAHSHGGNVVLEALPQITTALPNASPGKMLPNASSGKIVTLGTPFMDTMSPILKEIRRKQRVLFAPYVICCMIFAFSAGLLYGLRAYSFFDLLIFSYLLSLLAGLLLIGLFWYILHRKQQPAEYAFKKTAQVQPKFLAIGSLMDEPWQLLHHMRHASNPMAVQTNLFRYLISSMRARRSRNRQVSDLIYGTKAMDLFSNTWLWGSIMGFLLMFAIFWAEFGFMILPELARALALSFLIVTPLVIITLIFPHVATYVVRSRGWSVVQAIATGLEGYPYQLPLIEQYPSFLPENFVKYENMPTGAEQRALAARGDWIDRHLGDATQTFSKLIVTSADIALLLRGIEADQKLVHAAYYTDDECIERIADWIAGRG